MTSALQWGWRTRFDNVGAIVSVDRLTLKAQAMGGRTEMGFPMAGRIWVDTSFRAAYLLATLATAQGSISARLDAFGTRSRGSVLDGSYSENGWAITAAARHYSENGWAITAAARHALDPRLSLLAEILHADSARQDRIRLGLSPRQRQNQAQLELRVRI